MTTQTYNGPGVPPLHTINRPIAFKATPVCSVQPNESSVMAESLFKHRDSRSSRNSATSVASSSMFSTPPKREAESGYCVQHIHHLQHLEGLRLDQTENGFQNELHPERIQELDENESLSSGSRLDSLTSSPSPTKFAERGLSGRLDSVMIYIHWSPLQDDVQPISVQVGCKCHGLHIHRKELEEDQPEWKLRPVEVARDLVASFVELIQHAGTALEWSRAYLVHDIEWARGFCWGGDASYDVHRDGSIVLTADTSTSCPQMTPETREQSFHTMLRKMARVIQRRDAAASITVGETEHLDDSSLHAVIHVNHFCIR